jgi:hypothetical protein
MPYGLLAVDTITPTANLAISGNVTAAGTIVSTGTISSNTGTIYPLVSGTSQNSTSGTSINFTDIPSWVKRITLMLNGVSTSGSSNYLVQLGDAGGVETTGYVSASTTTNTTAASTSSTAGFIIRISTGDGAGTIMTGSIIFTLGGTNTWFAQGVLSAGTATPSSFQVSGVKTLSDVLTTVRLTTVNGTDTFDAGSVNILYE